MSSQVICDTKGVLQVILGPDILTSPPLGSLTILINTLQLPKQLQSTITLFLIPSVGIFHPCRIQWPVGLFFQPILVILCSIPSSITCLFLHMHINCKCANSALRGLLPGQTSVPLHFFWSLGTVQAINHYPLNLIVPTTYRSCCPHIQVIISLFVSTVLKSPPTFSYRPTLSLFSLWTLV